MTTRSVSENPPDIKDGAPFSNISTTHSPWLSTTKALDSGDDHRATFSAITAARRRPLFDPINRPQAERRTGTLLKGSSGESAPCVG